VSEIKLLVLAGGFGTRLKRVVSDVPKPMADVAGYPFLKYLIENWLQQGIRSYTFLLYHKAGLIEQFVLFDEMQQLLQGCEVNFVQELEPMGTGGAIAYAVKELNINESFLVVNADTWLGKGLDQLIDAVVPSLAVVSVPDTSRYGALELSDGKVEAFMEKSVFGGAGWINAGMYHLHSELFSQWDGRPFSLESVTFPLLVSELSLGYLKLDTDFIDIGVPEDYFRFCSWIESNKEGKL